jgi:hypothetical protein
VSVGGKYAGLYITITDLQRAYLMEDLSLDTMQGLGFVSASMPNVDSVTYTLKLQDASSVAAKVQRKTVNKGQKPAGYFFDGLFWFKDGIRL